MYNTFLFDLYGTLVDIRTDEQSTEVWQKLSAFYGYYGAYYEPKELQSAYLREEEILRMKVMKSVQGKEAARLEEGDSDSDVENVQGIQGECCPEIVLEYVFQTLFQQKGIEASYELSVHAGQFFRILSLKYIKLYRGIPDMLKTLKDRGKKVYLLSNAQQIFTEYEMNFLDIKKYFDGILFSSDAGFMKPDQRFYQAAIERFSIDTKTSVMIGNDFTCDILGAKAAGIDAFYVHTNISPAMPEDMGDTNWMMGMDGIELLQKLCK